MGASPLQNRTPPIPALAASQAPRTLGCSGMISASRMGLDDRLWAMRSKSRMYAWMCGVSLMRPFSECLRPCCRALNSPEVPGMASDMKRSCPMMDSQRFWLMRFLPRTSSKMAARIAGRCSASSSVCFMVSSTQPRMTFLVVRAPSPRLSFLTEAASCRWC